MSVNRKAASENDGQCSVLLSFEHGGDEIQVKRIVGFKKVKNYADKPDTTTHRYYIQKNGTIIIDPAHDMGYDNDFKTFIEGILPEAIAQFFFFDGERIQNYATEKPKPAITESIEKNIRNKTTTKC